MKRENKKEEKKKNNPRLMGNWPKVPKKEKPNKDTKSPGIDRSSKDSYFPTLYLKTLTFRLLQKQDRNTNQPSDDSCVKI